MKKMMTRRVRKRRRRRMTVMKTLRWRRPGKEGETETESGTALTPLPLHQKMVNPMTTPANTVAFPTIPSWCDTLLQNIFNFSQSGVLLLTSHFRSPRYSCVIPVTAVTTLPVCGLRSWSFQTGNGSAPPASMWVHSDFRIPFTGKHNSGYSNAHALHFSCRSNFATGSKSNCWIWMPPSKRKSVQSEGE